MRDFHTTKVWIDQSIQISMNNIFTCFQSNNSENPKKKQIKNDKFLKVPPKNLKNSYPRHKIEKKEIIAFTENTKKSLKIMWDVITFG